MRFRFRRAVFILLIFVGLAGIHLYIYTQNINLKYRVTDLKIKLSALQNRNRQLGSQVSAKEDLGHIEKLARKKLEMIYPEKINYVAAPRPSSEKASTEARP